MDRIKNYTHNFYAFLWHGVFLHITNAFTQITTVQSALLYSLTGSSALPGLLLAINRIGSILPQIFLVKKVEKMRYKKPFLIAAVLIRGASMVLISVLLLTFARPVSGWTIVIFFIIMAVFFFAGGMGDISYFAIFSGAVDPEKRGKFFGAKFFIGGILGLGAGYAASYIFENVTQFPSNYAIVYGLAGLSLFMAFGGFVSVREPAGEVKESARKWYQNFYTLREDKNFTRFIFTEILLSASHIAFPLYIIYAQKELGFSASWIGIFVAVQIAGEIITGPLWGKLGDKYNFRLVLFAIGIISAATPFAAVFLPKLNTAAYVAVFALIGMTFKGASIGISNYLLQIAPKDSVPTYVAVKNFAQIPTAAFPLIGGLMVSVMSFELVFITAGILMAIGTYFASTLFCARSANKDQLSMIRVFD